MKLNRIKLNIITNILSKLITLSIGIILPKLYIDYFGSEMNGLLSSIAGIFVYLNLLEAGVGVASVQALYGPLSKKDNSKVNGILSATNKFYRRTGVYFLACISFLAFIYPLVIKSEIDYTVIVLLIIISGITSALSYFFQGKYIILLNADNRPYVITTFNMIFNTTSNIAKILLIIGGFNVIIVQIIFSFISLLQIVAILVYVKKKYLNLNIAVDPDTAAISQKNSVLVHNISGVIFSNTDILLITIFLGLKYASVYTIYSMIFTNAAFIVDSISNSFTPTLGQLYASNKEKFNQYYSKYELFYNGILYTTFVTAFLLIIPFLKIYMGDVSDINYIDYKLGFLFMIVSILTTSRNPHNTVINIAGHFKQTQWKSFAEMMINIVASLLLVNFIGIYGLLIGTIIALLYRQFDIIIYSSKKLINRTPMLSIKRWGLNSGIGLLIISVSGLFNIDPKSYLEFIVVGIFVLISVGLLYFIIYILVEKEMRKLIFDYFSILRRKVKSLIGNA